MRLPDWIGIGCVKCGTSWLWREIGKHPETYTPKAKEMHFFNHAPKKNIFGYMRRLGKGQYSQKVGEFTPDYFHHYEAMYVIKDNSPSSKLIVSFRHPIERAFSNWKHAHNAGRFKGNFVESFNWWRVRERSVYAKYLKKWYELFPREQIHIVWYDDIFSKPTEVLKNVWDHIGVDNTFLSADYKDWYKFDYHENDEEYNKQKPILPEQRKKWLEYYLPHTEELEKLTGRDLTKWKS